MVDDTVDIELVKQRVTVLRTLALKSKSCAGTSLVHTLETEAVKTTTSYSSPTLFMNWSTPGRLITYTL
jgi:hypothetical protein